ncbi:MAG: FGGY-family carbohydrate kinase [Candidatus Lokiarchaeia archaeon]
MSRGQRNSEYLLGIDVGTTAVKSVLYDTTGGFIARASREYRTMHPKPGWAEHSPQLWWELTKETLREIFAKTGSSAKNKIAGICVSSLFPVVLPVDERGEPLRPAIIWMDARGGKLHDPLPKFKWIKENEPDVLKKTYKFLSGSGFINHKLTGQFTLDITQNLIATAAETYDFIDPNLFPKSHLFSEVIGEVTKKAAQETLLTEGTPVVAGAADAFSAMLGSGLVKAGRAVEFTGHSCTLMICTDKLYPKLRDEGLFSEGEMGFYVVSGAMNASGGLLRWFRDAFGYLELESVRSQETDSYQIMDLEASKVPPGSNGLVILPYIAGERSPIWNVNARGVIFGLYLTHTRAHIIRAILESVAYGLRHNIEIAERAGVRIEELRATGGGSKSDLWLQIKADVLNKPIHRVSADGETLGDALMAGNGVGIFQDLFGTCDELVKVKKVFNPNPKHHELYTKLYEIYREIYEPLKKSFDKLAEIRENNPA